MTSDETKVLNNNWSSITLEIFDWYIGAIVKNNIDTTSFFPAASILLNKSIANWPTILLYTLDYWT